MWVCSGAMCNICNHEFVVVFPIPEPIGGDAFFCSQCGSEAIWIAWYAEQDDQEILESDNWYLNEP